MKKRPRVRIRFKYNKDTGEIEEFIIDNNAPGASEKYHDGIARSIAGQLGINPEIEDAGAISLSEETKETVLRDTGEGKAGEKGKETEVE